MKASIRVTRSLDDLLTARGLPRKTIQIFGRMAVIEQHRLKIAQDIGSDWEILATDIGVSDVEVSDIKQVHTQEVQRSSTLMKRWHQLYGSEATYRRLMNGLMQIGRIDLIESLLADKPSGPQLKLGKKFWLVMLFIILGSMVLFFISITHSTLPMRGYQWMEPLTGDIYSIIIFSPKLLRRGKLNSLFIVTARMDFQIFSKFFRFHIQYSKHMAL